VRFTFAHPQRAEAELRAVLPPEVVSRVDWSSLHHESGSVVDPELKESQSDLLFSARLHGGQPLLFYVLLEHQSTVDRWMSLRMLRYVVRQLQHWRKEHPQSEALPVVVPLVMYHGAQGAWMAPRRLEELFALPGEGAEQERWRALVPRFEYLLDDLTAEREEALRARPGPPLARLALLLLRYGRDEELAARLEGWKVLFAQVQAHPEGLEDLRGVVRYLLEVGDAEAHKAMARVLKSVAGEQREEELMMTLGEKLIEQGRQQGLAEGQAAARAAGRVAGQAVARAEDVLRILAVRGIAVDEKARTLILTCADLATLDRWFDQALSAARFADLW
jgi:predicted transposase YdaD